MMNSSIAVTQHPAAHSSGTATRSMPHVLLRIEGIVVLIASFALYNLVGSSWWLFVLLAFAPDLVFIVYMLNRRLGTILYNMIHTYSLPVAMGTVALLAGWQLGASIAIIWIAHIAWDRAIGAGLKYPTGFSDTHLHRV